MLKNGIKFIFSSEVKAIECGGPSSGVSRHFLPSNEEQHTPPPKLGVVLLNPLYQGVKELLKGKGH